MKNSKKECWTAIPNIILDEVMSDLSGAELKCLLYIIRRTYGFQKKTDRIGASQFVEGIKNKNGERLDGGAGFCRKSLFNALKSLKDKGVIKIVNTTTKGNVYEIADKYQIGSSPKVGQKLHYFKDEKDDNKNQSSVKITPLLPQSSVKITPTKERGKKDKEKKEKDISFTTSKNGINKELPKNNKLTKIHPLKRKEKEKGATTRAGEYKEIETHWKDEYKKKTGSDPVLSYGKVRGRLKEVLKIKSVDEIKQAMTYYINSDRFKDTPTAMASLSEYSLNLAQANKSQDKLNYF